MLIFVLQVALYAAGAAIVIYLVYALFFSSNQTKPANLQKAHRRLERRQSELGPRRKTEKELAEEEDRRKASRRAGD